MSDAAVDRTIARLARDLTPVARLRPPWARALAWLAVVAGAAMVLACFADLPGLAHRLRAVPDMWLAVLGSCLTAVLGAVATFELSLPDRSPRWALLPLPGLALWIGGSGMGCLRTWVILETHVASLGEARDCLGIIVGLSVPLSALTFVMISRACPLRPELAASVGGLAVAAGSATLLNLFHPYDAGATDLAVHAAAVCVVVVIDRLLGGRFLARASRA